MLERISESGSTKSLSLADSMRFFHFECLPSTQIYAIERLRAFCDFSESGRDSENPLDSKNPLDSESFLDSKTPLDSEKPLDSEILEARFTPPFCIRALRQSEGIGSRGNSWDSVPNALCFSFVLPMSALPKDLRLESSSIFFGVIMQQFLRERGSSAWLKYPNDVYVEDKKVGGILTQKVKDYLVCGIGLNFYEQDSGRVPHNAPISMPSSASRHMLEPTLALDMWRNDECEGFLREFFKTFEKFHSWKQIFSIYQLEFHKNNAYSFHHGERRICLKDTTLNNDGSLSFEGQKIYSLR